MDALRTRPATQFTLRAAGLVELDHLSRLLEEADAEFRPHFPVPLRGVRAFRLDLGRSADE